MRMALEGSLVQRLYLPQQIPQHLDPLGGVFDRLTVMTLTNNSPLELRIFSRAVAVLGPLINVSSSSSSSHNVDAFLPRSPVYKAFLTRSPPLIQRSYHLKPHLLLHYLAFPSLKKRLKKLHLHVTTPGVNGSIKSWVLCTMAQPVGQSRKVRNASLVKKTDLGYLYWRWKPSKCQLPS
ncbi:hypothetical protein FF2_045508 [Malus domestica]